MVSNLSQTNSEYESLEEEYAQLSRKVEELEQRASGITPLISGQKWSRVFELIEQSMPQGISLRSLHMRGMLWCWKALCRMTLKSLDLW